MKRPLANSPNSVSHSSSKLVVKKGEENLVHAIRALDLETYSQGDKRFINLTTSKEMPTHSCVNIYIYIFKIIYIYIYIYIYI